MISVNKLTFLIVFQLIALKLLAQLEDPFSVMYNKVCDSSLYFQAYLELADNENLYLESTLSNNFFEMFATLNSYVGRYDDAIEYFHKRNIQKSYSTDTIITINVKDCGINQKDLNFLYNKYNVVLFNEEHHNPKYRAFVYSQLIYLKAKGYNQLAIEALNIKDINLQKRKYPTSITGFYTDEPVFGNLIRKALNLGFDLIAYDNTKMRRDKNQAKNIFKAYSPQRGKLVVFGGYGHIAQKGLMMGQHLKKMLKEDILSISLFMPYKTVELINTSSDEYYLKEDKTGYFDYFLFYKYHQNNINIPYWYKFLNYKIIPLNRIYNKQLVYPSLIQVSKPNEKDGIPIYQYLIKKTDSTNVNLAFPDKNLYNIIIININNIDTVKITIKDSLFYE